MTKKSDVPKINRTRVLNFTIDASDLNLCGSVDYKNILVSVLISYSFLFMR